MNYSTLSSRIRDMQQLSEISSIAFHAQPPDLRFASLIDMGFAIIGPLARRSRLRSGSCTLARVFCSTLPSDHRLAATPLRFGYHFTSIRL